MTRRLLICLLTICIFPFQVAGKDRKQHKKDMWDVFPFSYYNKRKDKRIDDLYEKVNEYLDKTHEYDKRPGNPSFLKNDTVLCNWTFENHRIWYHWGFNTNFRKFQPLVAAVNDNKNKGKGTIEDEKRFWKLLAAEVGKRNKELMSLAAETLFGCTYENMSKLMHRQVNGFVTILYNVHLFGDYTTKEKNALGGESGYKTLIGSTFDAIDNIAGKDSKNQKRAKKLKEKLRQVGESQDTAQQFLDELKNEFGRFVLSLDGPMYEYKQKFTNRGFPLKKY